MDSQRSSRKNHSKGGPRGDGPRGRRKVRSLQPQPELTAAPSPILHPAAQASCDPCFVNSAGAMSACTSPLASLSIASGRWSRFPAPFFGRPSREVRVRTPFSWTGRVGRRRPRGYLLRKVGHIGRLRMPITAILANRPCERLKAGGTACFPGALQPQRRVECPQPPTPHPSGSRTLAPFGAGVFFCGSVVAHLPQVSFQPPGVLPSAPGRPVRSAWRIDVRAEFRKLLPL
jgi:hypothetical protein